MVIAEHRFEHVRGLRNDGEPASQSDTQTRNYFRKNSTQLIMIFRWEGINNCIEQAKDLLRDGKVKLTLFYFLAIFAISI